MAELDINLLLHEVVKRNASDLHIQVGTPPMIRQQSELLPIVTSQPLTEEHTRALVMSVLDDDQRDILLKTKEVDFAFGFGELGRFRVNAYYERDQFAMSLRLIPSYVKKPEELGLPPAVIKFADYSQGLVLFSGPTGSGKSSSMAALIDKINSTSKRRIITIEDPIEFVHKSKNSIVVQREVHHDTMSFAAALRSALRQDPDVVLVGEMRDLETIAAAMTIAETGHLVFATLHTNSAAASINRVIDVFPPHQQDQIRIQLANSLQAVCAQHLVPGITSGRVLAAEVLIVNDAVRNLVREAKVHQIDSIIQNSSSLGMQGMDQTLASMVTNGIITQENAIQVCHNPLSFHTWFSGGGVK